jgi:hypothetical protein
MKPEFKQMLNKLMFYMEDSEFEKLWKKWVWFWSTVCTNSGKEMVKSESEIPVLFYIWFYLEYSWTGKILCPLALKLKKLMFINCYFWGVLSTVGVLWVLNTTLNVQVISMILWQSVLLVEEIGVPRENYWPSSRHYQNFIK